jgi:hypothetical protein
LEASETRQTALQDLESPIKGISDSNEEKNREEKKQKILSSKVGGHHSN